MPSTTLEFDAILFDMDGTLISSTDAVNQVWIDFAKKYDLDLDDVLANSHGVQTHMTFKRYLPSLSAEENATEVVRFEAGIIPAARKLEEEGKGGLVVLPGVSNLLSQLRTGPPSGWAIVTSATGTYGYAALDLKGPELGPMPAVIVTADDVSRGKPFPDPYEMGAKKLNVDVKRCLVVEDAPSGARSGLAAGAKVLAVGTGHDIAAVRAANPDFYVDDLSQVSAEWKDGKLFVTINEKDE